MGQFVSDVSKLEWLPFLKQLAFGKPEEQILFHYELKPRKTLQFGGVAPCSRPPSARKQRSIFLSWFWLSELDCARGSSNEIIPEKRIVSQKVPHFPIGIVWISLHHIEHWPFSITFQAAQRPFSGVLAPERLVMLMIMTFK
ncbi:hypothetical protein HUJ05_011415 [Dendroctonus ponderosae]|nr:hypothetical protein HUJ05_011415 [Dendroctonus ponderosae]